MELKENEVRVFQRKCQAKVNWHLAVLGKRESGYHSIESVFQLIDLHDELTVEVRPARSFSFELEGLEGICTKGLSTLDKAAAFWHEKTKTDVAVRAVVRKNIPVLSGLGGGSSDAAGLLDCLLEISCPESADNVAWYREVACNVGCDVPFFLSHFKAAYVTGEGAEVREIQAREDLSVRLVFSEKQKQGTGQSYAELDRRKSVSEVRGYENLVGTYNRPVRDWDFSNDFEIVNRRPEITVSDNQALLLTGSGNCYVLVSDGINTSS